MNLELLESYGFGQNYPEELNGVLDSGTIAITAGFNRKGTLLAVGYNDGRVIIWDFMTRGMVKIIEAHAHPVSSVCWSRDGKKLLTGSTDFNICMIDVLSGDLDGRCEFPAPVFKVQFNPRNTEEFLICSLKQAVVLLDKFGTTQSVPIHDTGDVNITATFDKRGKYVYTGNSKGKIEVYQFKDMKYVASFRIGGSNPLASISIKNMEFSRTGELFLVNCSDKVIRVYNSNHVLLAGVDGDPEPVQKLQDLVNKTNWRKASFSGDGEYICAGSARQHSLYIWDKNIGNLVTILHGAKNEPLLDLVWHPVRPIIASISNGVVSIWTQGHTENWSAFAPDFKELDENVDCEERESEFDEEDEDKAAEYQNRRKIEEEDMTIDVESVDPVPAFISSDECSETEVIQFIPTAREIENAEAWGRGHQGQEGSQSHKRLHPDEDEEEENVPTKSRSRRRKTKKVRRHSKSK